MNYYAMDMKNSEKLVLLYMDKRTGKIVDTAFFVKFILNFKNVNYGYQVLNELEQKGLVEKKRLNRTMIVSLTRKGREYIEFFYGVLDEKRREKIEGQYKEQFVFA